ncbi:hypothetical protein [Caryophanon tenue]|uniref:hypothetical protein n=1 Tax=Caryophanon tenue TaxID=33978 RepID=UPI003CCB97E1
MLEKSQSFVCTISRKRFQKNQGYFGVGRTVRSLADLRTSYEEAVKLSNFLAHCSKKRVQVVD